MAATMQIREKNTAGETPTNKTSGTCRFKNADNATVDAVNPMTRPLGGAGNYDRSWEKWYRLYVNGAFTSISNPLFYMDGANNYGTGIMVYVRTANASVFATPVEATVETSHTDAFSYTSGAAKDMDAVNPGPFDSSGVPKDIADYLVGHMRIEGTAAAPQNPCASEAATWQFDEL
jgi:hypothetical protein